MATNIVTPPTSGAPVSTDDYDAQNDLIQALMYSIQKSARILTEWDTLVEPEIADGVYIQHGGSLYLVDGDEAISGSPSDGRVYVKVTESLGVLNFSFVNSAVGYAWNDVYHGYYHSDGSQLLPVGLIKSGTDYIKFDGIFNFDITNTYKFNTDVDFDDNELQNAEFQWDQDTGILIKSGTVPDIYIKKPVTAYAKIIGGVGATTASISIYQNGSFRIIASAAVSAGGTTYLYGLSLNPGRYTFNSNGTVGPTQELYCTGVFGRDSIVASEIVEDV